MCKENFKSIIKVIQNSQLFEVKYHIYKMTCKGRSLTFHRGINITTESWKKCWWFFSRFCLWFFLWSVTAPWWWILNTNKYFCRLHVHPQLPWELQIQYINCSYACKFALWTYYYKTAYSIGTDLLGTEWKQMMKQEASKRHILNKVRNEDESVFSWSSHIFIFKT